MRIPRWNQPSPPNLVVSVIAAVVGSGLGGILGAGLPGFGFLELAQVMGEWVGFDVERELGSSNLWGTAILVSLAWTWVFPPASLLLHRLYPGMAWTLRVVLCLVAGALFALGATFFMALIAW